MTMMIPLERWLDKTRKLLQMEREAEISQAKLENDTLPATSNPNVLLRLFMTSASTGLFGRTVLVLKHNHGREFGAHHFSVGDLVSMCIPTASLTPTNADGFPKGIVTKVDDNSISVAFEDLEDSDGYHNEPIRLDRLVNDATYRKLNDALDELAKFSDGPAQHIVNVIFHGAAPTSNPLPAILDVTNPPSSMNASQVDAIQFALASKDVALIHGPPGTGKTTTLVEFIRQCVRTYKMKVLVCAPSNVAVDNILAKMAAAESAKRRKAGLRMTRVGHPARLLPAVLKYCLDAKIAAAEGTQIIADIRKELGTLKATKATFQNVRQERKALRKEIREREQNVVADIIQHSDVVFATNAGAATKLLRNVVFDVVVIDEAAQALEASCWIPLLRARRCVLAGDHHQLPPTIQSESAKRQGLGLTLFDRVTQMEHSKCVVRMLSTQYRMHRAISDWSSKAMYASQLASCDSVASRKLSHLPHVTIPHDNDALDATLLLIDTAGCGLDEESDEGGGGVQTLLGASKSNPGEAQVVAQHVTALLATGLKPSEVAVITPYNGQVGVLRRLLHPVHPTLEIRSVDGFQGCEKEAVVMSLVRSNCKNAVGFLADDRRMNVAVTRAKRHVALIGDTDTLGNHPFLKTLIDHFELHGECQSAQEYADITVEGDWAEVETPVVATTKPAKATSSQPKPQKKQGQTVKKGAGKTVPIPPEIVPLKEDQEDSVVEVDEQKVSVAIPSAFAALTDAAESDQSSSASSEEEETVVKEMNATLKELHLARLARTVRPPPPPKKTSKNKAKPEVLLVKGYNDHVLVDEDEWGFLDRQVASANSCAFVACGQKTHVHGSMCRFCKYKFCYAHGLAEIHGCGAAVRTFERAKATKKQPPTNTTTRQAMQKALDTKLTKASDDRKAKAKKK
ncbi:hypothetical protein H257_15438 [Aphanomyces astaci]|uniref:DNA helicase n=1 Tax=Aphanomyces astaci TaxID=112090 RepID=W4FPP2_APHAT|nr:hypothetical protein H257_15438 [Aphanomyces astaci]ETV68628.1 hypothetical protein H257_15438 [Aphanomyces astaci]|eukprot:XP_009841853.1 hypothetical protein H257_15438 [Aphanomyces astaci]